MKITPMTITEAVNEGLSVFEMWRKLGYPSANIFLSTSLPLKEPREVEGMTQVTMVLKGDGGKQFVLAVGFVLEHRDVFTKAWKQGALDWNKNWTNAKRKQVFENSWSRRSAVDIIAAMAIRGFTSRRNLN